MVTYGSACGMGVYRMWKEGNRMSVPPKAVRASARSTAKLRPDSQGGSDQLGGSLDMFVVKGSIASKPPPVHL